MNAFWSKVMPASIANYKWAGEFAHLKTEKAWKEEISAKIKAMDEGEFDLFLAGVVMTAAKEQMMGLELTEKVKFFRDLRG